MLDVHGKAKGKSFFRTLLAVRSFLQKNPREFVVLEVTQSKSLPLTEIQQNLLREVFVHLFSSRLVTRADCEDWFSVRATRMADLWSRSKQVLALFPGSLTKDGFVSCRQLTKKNQKRANYRIAKRAADAVGLLPRKEFLADISVKTASKKDFFARNAKNVALGSPDKLVENQFLIKARIDRSKVLDSVKNFFKSAIRGTKDLCLDLLNKDQLVRLVLAFCREGRLNVGRSLPNTATFDRVDVFSGLLKLLVVWNFGLCGRSVGVSVTSVLVSTDSEFRKSIKSLFRSRSNSASNVVPEVMDTTGEMAKGEFSIAAARSIDITAKVKAVSTQLGPLRCVYIDKDKFRQVLAELKIKKCSLEVVYSVLENNKKLSKRLSLTKLTQSVFLCPDPEDLEALSNQR